MVAWGWWYTLEAFNAWFTYINHGFPNLLIPGSDVEHLQKGDSFEKYWQYVKGKWMFHVPRQMLNYEHKNLDGLYWFSIIAFVLSLIWDASASDYGVSYADRATYR